MSDPDNDDSVGVANGVADAVFNLCANVENGRSEGERGRLRGAAIVGRASRTALLTPKFAASRIPGQLRD